MDIQESWEKKRTARVLEQYCKVENFEGESIMIKEPDSLQPR